MGTYRELIGSSLQNRLTEVNPNYIVADAILSLDQLRQGAELLAAASELTGRAYMSAGPLPSGTSNEIDPVPILTGWKPNEITRLLASSVFDEAAYGKVQFHDRSTRAYLAACWANRQLVLGVPLHRVLALFAVSPFDARVLIPGRRWALSWLAAINVATREWLVQHFPEMLVFDGDPQSWDTACP